MGLFATDPSKDPNSDDRTRIDPGDYLIEAFNNSVKEMTDQNRIVMREMMQTYGKAAVYDSWLLTLPPQQAQPILLAGFDLSRMRMLVSTSNGQTVVGKWETVSSGQGFYLPVGGSTEFLTVDAIYVRNVDQNNISYVSVWVEKSAQ